MSTQFDPDGRGPSRLRLLLTGIGFALVLTVAAGTMIANSRGTFRSTVPVTAEMANVGDGLPPNRT